MFCVEVILFNTISINFEQHLMTGNDTNVDFYDVDFLTVIVMLAWAAALNEHKRCWVRKH